MDVCMLLQRTHYGLRYDSRVKKEAASLIKAGHDVSILIYGREEKGVEVESLNTISVEVPDIPLISRYNPYRQRLFGMGLDGLFYRLLKIPYQILYYLLTLRELLSIDCDVFHCHDFETLPVGYLAGKLRKKKIVYDSHEIWFEDVKRRALIDRLKNRLIAPLEGHICRRIDCMITVNESLKAYFIEKYGVKNIISLYNFAPLITGYALPDIRKEYCLSRETRLLVYVGQFDSYRGLSELSDIVSDLGLDFCLFLIGYGYEKHKIVDETRETGSRITFIDPMPQEDLIRFISGMDVGLCVRKNVGKSFYLSSPNKVFEYIAAGLPFVVSDFPEMRRFAVDEDMGEVCDPEDPDSIIKAVFDLINDTEGYERKKINCKRLYELKYNWGAESEKLTALYKRLDLSQ